jgi:hypothetical protein
VNAFEEATDFADKPASSMPIVPPWRPFPGGWMPRHIDRFFGTRSGGHSMK